MEPNTYEFAWHRHYINIKKGFHDHYIRGDKNYINFFIWLHACIFLPGDPSLRPIINHIIHRRKERAHPSGEDRNLHLQYIPRNMHTVTALLCFVVVIHWLIFPYPSGLLHWHCGNLTIAPVPAKQPWWIWINTSCEFIMNDCITTTKQSTTKTCAYF